MGSIAPSPILELHKASPSPQTEVIVQTSPPHLCNHCPYTSSFKAKKKETSYNQNSCSHFREICSLCSSGLMHSQATSRQPLKKCQIGYLLNPMRRAFFLAEQCLRLGTESSEENWAPLTFYFSHYSSHCLKSNFTSALFCQGRN